MICTITTVLDNQKIRVSEATDLSKWFKIQKNHCFIDPVIVLTIFFAKTITIGSSPIMLDDVKKNPVKKTVRITSNVITAIHCPPQPKKRSLIRTSVWL